MQADEWNKVLMDDIPNLLKASKSLEDSVSPLLAKISVHRDEAEKQVGPELMSQFDKAMKDVKKAKDKLKKHGNNSNK